MVEVYYKDRKKVIWQVVDDHVVQEGVEYEELGILGFDFNLFDEEREGYVGYDVKELPYLLMIMKLWTSYWEEELYHMNKKVDQDNGIGETQKNGLFGKI